LNDILKQIGETGIVPVIAITDPSKAAPLARALLDGGINCAEITFRTDCAAECIRLITSEVKDISVCAGTVLTVAQVDEAVNAGAKFIVTPGFNPKVVKYCLENDTMIVPGAATPSEMETAMEQGIFTLKFFPAQQAGGIDYIKAVSAPYPDLRFMPTGGINPSNIGKYMSFNKVLACGGSWMVEKSLIAAGNFEEITKLCREALLLIKYARTHLA